MLGRRRLQVTENMFLLNILRLRLEVQLDGIISETFNYFQEAHKFKVHSNYWLIHLLEVEVKGGVEKEKTYQNFGKYRIAH